MASAEHSVTRSRAALLVGAASLAAALAATLLPAPEAQAAAARTPWWCVTCGGAGIADAFLNLFLLLPLGVAARMRDWRLSRAVALCCALSIAVEIAQGAVIVGRDASLGDVVMNTAGGALGWLAARHWHAVLRPAPRAARLVAGALGIALVCSGAVATYLLRPAMSAVDYTRVRFAPAAVGRPTFRGTVYEFALNDSAYDDRSVPSALPTGEVTARVAFTWADSDPGTATIVRIDGAGGDAVLSFDVRGPLLRADLHTRASALGLRSAPVGARLPASLRPGDTVRAEFRWTGNEVALSATAPGSTPRVTTGTFRAWHAWILLNPFTGAMLFDGRAAGWTAVWLGGWLLLIGWYVRRSIVRKVEKLKG
jgi:hypothetical protein